jgi:hypothetical protein
MVFCHRENLVDTHKIRKAEKNKKRKKRGRFGSADGKVSFRGGLQVAKNDQYNTGGERRYGHHCEQAIIMLELQLLWVRTMPDQQLSCVLKAIRP